MAATVAGAAPGRLSAEVVKREGRAAALVFLAVAAFSALGGVVWAYLAPAEQLLVVEPDRGAPLTGESTHRFDAVAIYVLIAMVVAVLTAVATWRWRRVRGPILLVGLLAGAALGSSLMRWVGEAVAEQLHTRPAHPPVRSIVEIAPIVEGWPVLLVQPLLAALIVLIMAALSTSDDLGSGEYLPFGGELPQPEVVAPGFGTAMTYGPYANGAPAQPLGPRDPVVPFEAPGSVPESDRTR